MKGKYENDYYIIGSTKATDFLGNQVTTYWITWLDRGTTVSGFNSASEARNNADRTVINQRIREGLDT